MSLSIVVPTRDRPDTLIHCLQTIVSQVDTRLLEIIVSDNCSSSETKAVIDSFQDARIRYIRPTSRLGMSEHWEFALSHAKGDWVTIIGDDDGLMRGAVEKFFCLVAQTEAKAISTQRHSFSWPVARYDGRLSVRYGTGAEARSGKAWVEKCLRGKCSHKELPWIYTGGFVHREIIKKIIRKSGRFFNSISPDIYSAIAIGSIVEEYFYSFEPIAIGGTSWHSTGTSHMAQAAKSSVVEEFFKENAIGFLPALGNGQVQSLPIHIYEAYLKSSELRSWSIDTSLAEQLALTIVNAKSRNKNSVIAYCKRVAVDNSIDYQTIMKFMPKIKAYRLVASVRARLKGVARAQNLNAREHNINNIDDAARYISEFVA